MGKPLSSRTLLSLVLAAPLLGCAAKSPEKPIVLRQPAPESRLARRVPSRVSTTAAVNPPLRAGAPISTASAAPKLPLPAQTADTAGVGELPPPNQMPAEQPAQDRILTGTEKAALFHDFDQYLTRSGHVQ